MDRSNEEWLDGLRGPNRNEVLADLRTLLLHGLRYAMVDRYQVTDADIEEFVQEALLKILAGLDSFRGDSRFTTWAQKVAVHEAFSELRRKRWQDVSLQDLATRYEGDFIPAVLADRTASPEQRVTQQMILELVVRLIVEELTVKQRRAMIAVMLDDMPLQEAARHMGITRNALYKRLHDARQRLRDRLVEEGLSLDDVLAAFGT